ncbi:hypothetical protein ACVXHA_08570 [Escherichia coli]
MVGAPDVCGTNQQGLPAAWLDAREFYALNAPHNRRLMKGLDPLLQQLLAQHPGKRLVVTGFISRNNAGETVLLGVTVPTIPRHKSVRWRCLSRNHLERRRRGRQCRPA